MKYNDFVGSVRYSSEDKIFHGKLEFISDLVTFEGTSVSELEAAFIEAVDDYVELCKMAGKKPEKSFTGSFNIRIKPELHRQVAMASLEKGVSINQVVMDALYKYISQ